MRLVVKKWGNGLAVRLPRESAEFGRLEEGDELEADIRRVLEPTDWRPHVIDSGLGDLAERHDYYAWSYLDERFPRGADE
jgi:hypothetical protein